MKGELNYTLEDYEYENKVLDLELTAVFEGQPYVPASMYGGPDGLGWPAEGGEIELIDIRVEDPAMPEKDRKILEKTLWKDSSLIDKLEDKARDDLREITRERRRR